MHSVHINRGTGRRYVARVKYRGMRSWLVLGRHRTLEPAARRAAIAMARSAAIKHGEVLLITDYYDPFPVLTMVRE